MFFKWKKKYMFLKQRFELQKEYVKGIRKDKETYDNIIENFNFIMKKYKDNNLNIYFLNDRLYYIVEIWLPDIGRNDYQIDLYTYRLDKHLSQISPIAILNSTIRLSYDYRIKTAYIDSLDTTQELHKGHGSQILKRFVTITENSNVNFIRGKLYQDTHIGIENLKNFYIKNGFEIRENSIFKLIKNVEEKIEY